MKQHPMTGLGRKRLQWENWILPDEAEGIFQRIYSFTRTVPEGKVVSYGDVARQCGTIAVLVGKAMAVCPPDVPWHRVVGADGTLRIAKRGPEWALRQRKLLELEGVPFLADGRVDMQNALYNPQPDGACPDEEDVPLELVEEEEAL
jgi:methylated-DNA-protein-cysteine methyltransferase-like protein